MAKIQELGSSSLINYLIIISEDATDDWGSHQQKELEFTGAYGWRSIRRDTPPEIWFQQFVDLWPLTLTCAIKQLLVTRKLACNMQDRYLALHSTMPILVPMMS